MRSGSLLAMMLVATTLAALLGMALTDRAVRGARTGQWGREHATLRLVAESAVEELFQKLALAANEPSHPAFAALRSVAAGAAEVPGLDCRVARALAADGNAMPGLPAQLAVKVRVERWMTVSADPVEGSGRLAFEVTARAARRGGPSVFVKSERAFHVALGGLPPVLSADALIVSATERDRLVRLPPGRPARVPQGGSATSLFDVLTAPPPRGLDVLPAGRAVQISGAIDALMPPAMMVRAHFLTRSRVELNEWVDNRKRAGARLDGVIHCTSQEPLLISYPEGFSGRCTISTLGPVVVQDVRLDDPARDALTIVSGTGIVVEGTRVDANLVALASPSATVTFARVAQVAGTVIVRRFPRGRGIGGPGLGQCLIGGATGGTPAYHVALAPAPSAHQMRRDEKGWAAW